jgi:hypothetical protein
MPVSRFSTSSVAQGFPKYQKLWNGTSNISDVFGDNSTSLFYTLDSDFTDLRGNASSFTTSNVTFSSGKFNNAATYNGTSSTSYKDVSGILTGTTSRSISVWSYINAGATGRQLIFGQGSFGINNQNFDFEANCYNNSSVSDSYGIHYWGNGIKFDSATTMYNQWVHLVVTQSGGDINTTNTKLYINGVQKTLNSWTTATYSIPTTSRLCIGTRVYSSGTDLYSNGKIDQLRVFNKVLTQSEVNELYNGGSGS